MRSIATRGGALSWPARRGVAVVVALAMVIMSASLAAAAGSGWSIQPTPNPTGANINYLSGVSCPSPSTCTAVGQDAIVQHGNGRIVTLAERWDGTGWRIQPTPNPSGAHVSFLRAVSCSSRSACTAVGAHWSGKKLLPLVERWDGARWRVQPTAGRGYLTGVSCPSLSVCTAVGYHGKATKFLTLVERWDGARWRIQPTPNPAGPRGRILDGVSCPSRNTCTAVGSYVHDGRLVKALVERWDGTSWSTQPTPNPAGGSGRILDAVSCASRSTCTAAGSYINGTRKKSLTLVERWDGTRWRIQRTPNPAGADDSDLDGVSCPSGSACIAVGRYFHGILGPGLTLVERWDGTRWRIQPTPNPAGATASFLEAASCSSRGACTAVGYYYTGIGRKRSTLAERWHGP